MIRSLPGGRRKNENSRPFTLYKVSEEWEGHSGNSKEFSLTFLDVGEGDGWWYSPKWSVQGKCRSSTNPTFLFRTIVLSGRSQGQG